MRVVFSVVNKNLWAKKQEKNGRFMWLPLKQHLEDTRFVISQLWNHWLSDGQKRMVTESLSEPCPDLAQATVEFVGMMHDIGKATPSFQTIKGFVNSPDLDRELLERLERDGFTGISSLELSSSKQTHHSIAGQTLFYWYGVNEDLASVIGGHHGNPIDSITECDVQRSYIANYYQVEDPNSLVYQKWDKTQRDYFKWGLQECGFETLDELPEVSQPGLVIISGLVIMADWIASNENYFPLLSIDEYEVESKKVRYIRGWNMWRKDIENWEPKPCYDIDDLYEDRFGFEEGPRDVQRVFSETIDECDKPGIFILEAPMGVGKTEAALAGVEQLAEKTGCSGLFFGLPTQATSDGIFPRVKEWLESVGEDSYGAKHSIRLHHGKAALNEEFSQISNDQGYDESHIVINEWFSGRKTASLDDFVVGTVDQFLLVALKQRHLMLRHLGFSKKVVVIDEVHAYDAYMSQYLEMSLHWMGAYKVPVIILSATLPAQKRKELVTSYMLGLGAKKRDVEKAFEDMSLDAYPLITYSDGLQVREMTEFKKQTSKKVSVKKIAETDIYQTLDKLTEDGGIVGVIVNTVKKAQELAEECSKRYGQDIVELLHSAFIATDRVDKERNLKAMIGKDGSRPDKKIIIGTQVIEQSLDIDFDVMISDLAPIDLLIQRVGRLHRHEIDRPVQHKEPVLYVLGTSDSLEFDGGSEAVYGGYLLARTQYYLPNELVLPDDISPLVQKVYGDDKIVVEPELEEVYNEMCECNDFIIINKKSKAKTYRLSKPQKKSRRQSGSLVGWLSNTVVNTSEEYAYAQVRDSHETIEVVAVKRIGDGYGMFSDGVDISTEITDHKIAKGLSKQTLRLPSVLSRYNADKTIEELEEYNSLNLPKWQKQNWLKGTLGIIFDENNQFKLGDYLLTYDSKYGLMYERM